jgi:hypothetical protein
MEKKMSGYNVGELVGICCERYPEGTTGIVIDRVADFVYNVRMTHMACTWNEEFLEDEIKHYTEPQWRTLLDEHFKKTNNRI